MDLMNTKINKTKELLNMFWASAHIQEELMYVEPDPKQEYDYGHYKKDYRVILEEIKDLHKEIASSIEAKVFWLGTHWWNDLFDILYSVVTDEFGDDSEENRDKYFSKYVEKYVDEYKEKYLKDSKKQ